MTNPTNEGAAAAAGEGGAQAAEGAQGAAAADAGNGGAQGSLLGDAAAQGGEGAAGQGNEPGAWLPEKYRVTDEAGTLDEAASSRKLADAYRALETKLGKAASLPPATPDEYKLEPPEGVEGEAFEQFTGDELFKAFAKDAHEQGLSNEQLQFVVGKYLAIAPNLMRADAQLSTEEARAKLEQVWEGDDLMKNLGSAARAIKAYGAQGDAETTGSAERLMDKYGNDPDFAVFAANVARELGEDKLPGGSAPSADMDIEAMQASEPYWKADHPDHAKVKAKVDAHYARKFGTQPRRGSVSTV